MESISGEDFLRPAHRMRRIGQVKTELIRNLCGVEKRVEEGVLCWYGHVIKVEEARVVKSMSELPNGRKS